MNRYGSLWVVFGSCASLWDLMCPCISFCGLIDSIVFLGIFIIFFLVLMDFNAFLCVFIGPYSSLRILGDLYVSLWVLICFHRF